MELAESLLYQLFVTFGLIAFTLNAYLNLRSMRMPRGRRSDPLPQPSVSVLVPARDEEANIGRCLRSLQRQDYSDLEVLVLDDGSSDGTAEIVAAIAATDKRVRLLKGEPLPAGWAGKPYACLQLARQARGEWLLFTDADTVHSPAMLRSVLALAMDKQVSLLSGFPRQLADSWPLKAAIPVLYFVLLSWLPLWWLQRAGKSRPSLAIGQFLLFNTTEYWRIGGHEAVKGKIMEDVWLGVEVRRHGGRHLAVDLSSVVSCQMYRSVRPMWEGFVKWVHSVAVMSPVGLIALMLAGVAFFLLPFLLLPHELLLASAPSDWRPILLLQVVVILLARWLVDSRLGMSKLSTVLHPLGFTFLVVVSVYAGLQRTVGASIRWKSRSYSNRSGVK